MKRNDLYCKDPRESALLVNACMSRSLVLPQESAWRYLQSNMKIITPYGLLTVHHQHIPSSAPPCVHDADANQVPAAVFSILLAL